MKDIEIRTEVLRQIDREQIADCGELRVRVHRGRITLAGWVQTEAQKILAEAIADSVAGGRQVINRIRVPDAARRRRDLALAERIEQCLAANAPPAEAIQVSVLNGVAKLSGCVDFDSERRRAETEVLCLPGLSGMRGRISVRAPQPAAPPSMAQADLIRQSAGRLIGLNAIPPKISQASSTARSPDQRGRHGHPAFAPSRGRRGQGVVGR